MPELHLRRMTDAEFASFRSRATRGYGAVQVAAGNWRAEAADALALASFDELVPSGLATDGTLLCVAELPGGDVAGEVWVALSGPSGAAEAWIYSIEVAEAHRGRGYGRALLEATEREVAARGITQLGLNVFGANVVARSLYESAGYETVSLQMRKPLDP